MSVSRLSNHSQGDASILRLFRRANVACKLAEASFVSRLKNQGTTSAQQIELRIRSPRWTVKPRKVINISKLDAGEVITTHFRITPRPATTRRKARAKATVVISGRKVSEAFRTVRVR